MFPLIAENLVVEFNGKHILGPLDLTVNKGDISLILGPNGSGKTTLLKSLHGIVKLKRGSIKWSCSDNSSMKKQMFVFQTPIMLRRSVLENLTYPLLLRKVSNSKAHRLATEWAEKIGLKPNKEDVGQTLGTYGVGPGCYFVLPVLGPTTARDSLGMIADSFIDPFAQITLREKEILSTSGNAFDYYSVKATTAIDFRADNDKNFESLEKNSIDLYASFKSLYLQNRENKISFK